MSLTCPSTSLWILCADRAGCEMIQALHSWLFIMMHLHITKSHTNTTIKALSLFSRLGFLLTAHQLSLNLKTKWIHQNSASCITNLTPYSDVVDSGKSLFRKGWHSLNNMEFATCAVNQFDYCNDDVNCTECGSSTHVSAVHSGPASWSNRSESPASECGRVGESGPVDRVISSACDDVCGGNLSGCSCSKICLVRVSSAGRTEAAVWLYAILDEQSNKSLAWSEFFNIFGITGKSSPYSLKTCAGTIQTDGRQACGFQVESMDGSITLPLPALIECNEIQNNRSEIPTLEVALNHTHLKHLANQIPELDPRASNMLLLGRDIIRVHKV